ncbi:MAG TPA: S24/S26 family peptidase [Terriglobales bacterium]|jgi:signal peptidase I|nr:S24/S26 family peptidase [Terriglobales bacterium]
MAAVPTAESLQGELLAETILRHGKARLRVQGTSMLPSLWPGDVLEVARRAPAEIETGAIILYRREQRLFAHRVLKKETRADDGCLVARGDRLSRPDPPVRPEELLGEVIRVERAGKAFAPARRASWAAALLRWVSRVSDAPAGLLLRLASPNGPPSRLPELASGPDASR